MKLSGKRQRSVRTGGEHEGFTLSNKSKLFRGDNERVIKQHGGNTEARTEEQIARLESQVPTKYAHTKENCVVYQEGGPPCPDCIETKDNHLEPSGVSLSQDGQKE